MSQKDHFRKEESTEAFIEGTLKEKFNVGTNDIDVHFTYDVPVCENGRETTATRIDVTIDGKVTQTTGHNGHAVIRDIWPMELQHKLVGAPALAKIWGKHAPLLTVHIKNWELEEAKGFVEQDTQQVLYPLLAHTGH